MFNEVHKRYLGDNNSNSNNNNNNNNNDDGGGNISNKRNQNQKSHKKSNRNRNRNRKRTSIKNQILFQNYSNAFHSKSTSTSASTSTSTMAISAFSFTVTVLLLIFVILQQNPSYAIGSGGGTSHEDYLYTSKRQFEVIYHGEDNGNDVKDSASASTTETDKDKDGNSAVWPIRDYVRPKYSDSNSESKEEYTNRITNPPFLGDEYDMPRVVEFYAPWCGHCIHFKPHYISLGKETNHLNPLIHFYAVSCVAHSNICQNQNVHGYPTLKFFSEHNSTGVVIDRNHLNAKSLDKEYFQKYSMLGVNGKSASEEDSGRNNGVDSSSTIEGGAGGSKNIDHVRISGSGNDTGNVEGNVNGNGKNAAIQKNKLGAPIIKKPIAVHSSTLISSSSSFEDVMNPNDPYINAEASLEFAFRSSIFMTRDPLSSTDAKILKEWLTLLHQTLPSPSTFSSLNERTKTKVTAKATARTKMEPMMKASVKQVSALMSNLDYVAQGEDELLEILQYDGGMSVKEKQWTKSCSKGIPKVGYTCGLWQLFHIVTVGLVHFNIEQELHGNNPMLLSTMKTADTIRDYIEHYFTCDECRLNFVKMYEECRFERCNRLSSMTRSEKNKYSFNDWKQLALWLWEAHNDVNVRLLHERLGPDEFQRPSAEAEDKVKWPSKSDCPECWYDGGGWNEDIVYDYLDSFYWPTKHEIVDENEKGVTSYLQFFISIVGIILLLVFVHFRKKRKQHKNLKKN